MRQRLVWIPILVIVPLAGLAGCSDEGSTGLVPPGGGSNVRLASADVQIDGRSVNGETIERGSGASTLFTVALAHASDRSRIQRMQMDYPVHSGMGMMGERSSVECRDDGTNGDAVAGDGIYSYMDVDGHVGPHAEGCPAGEYVYTFHGTDLDGTHTNSLECRVTVR